MPRLRPVAASLLLLPLAACQAILATDATQCRTDADCFDKGGAGLVCRNAVCSRVDGAAGPDGGSDANADPWACLAAPPGKPPEDRSRPLIRRNRYVAYSLDDCQHNRGVAGVIAKLCTQRDLDCISPVEVAEADCEGYFTLRALYAGFEGYLELAAPRPVAQDGGAPAWPANVSQCFEALAAKEAADGTSLERCAVRRDAAGRVIVPLPSDLMPTLEMLVPPPSKSDDPSGVIELGRTPTILSEGTVRGFLAALGQTIDPKAGHLLGQALDCRGNYAAGVAITVNGTLGGQSQIFFTDPQGLPNTTQGETSVAGDIGYVNIDTGAAGIAALSITATRQATRERIGVYAAQVRSGYVTLLPLPPIAN